MKTFFTAVLAAAFFLSFTDRDAQAQSIEDMRFEAGGQFSILRVTETQSFTIQPQCITTPCPPITNVVTSDHTDPAFGGRLGYNLTRNVALEAGGHFFPRERFGEGGRKFEGLFGIKVGQRFEKAGIFGKARPGFLYQYQGDLVQRGVCPAIFPPPAACFEGTGLTTLALDVGGVEEVYPIRRTILRFYDGDMI